jgi:hypothetical protein
MQTVSKQTKCFRCEGDFPFEVWLDDQGNEVIEGKIKSTPQEMGVKVEYWENNEFRNPRYYVKYTFKNKKTQTYRR